VASQGLACWLIPLLSCLPSSSTMKMVKIRSSETHYCLRSTGRYNPEDRIIRHHRANHKWNDVCLHLSEKILFG
jgi:hypothetical protein